MYVPIHVYKYKYIYIYIYISFFISFFTVIEFYCFIQHLICLY